MMLIFLYSYNFYFYFVKETFIHTCNLLKALNYVMFGVNDMIFILNLNPISLSFLKSWSFNMVLEFGLVGGRGFEPSLCKFEYLIPFC